MSKLTTQQIGRCGELLVQYMLLKYGIESAPLTTDTGIDLVAYPRIASSTWPANRPATIQVKTSTHRGDETNGKWIEWNLPADCPADYVAAVDIERNKLWLFKFADFKALAKRAGEGQLRLWWSLPKYESERSARKEEQFKDYEMDAAVPKLFTLK